MGQIPAVSLTEVRSSGAWLRASSGSADECEEGNKHDYIMGDAYLIMGLLNQGLQPDIAHDRAVEFGNIIRFSCDHTNLSFLLDTNSHGHEEGFITTAGNELPAAIQCLYDPHYDGKNRFAMGHLAQPTSPIRKR